MVTKTLVIPLCLILALVVATAHGQDWQSAELVDEIRHTQDSIWIHDRATPQQQAVPRAQPVAARAMPMDQYGSMLLEQSADVSQLMDISALKDLVTNQVRATLEPQIRAEVEARIERERAESRLIETVAKRVATWGDNFRFRAEDASTPTAPTITMSNQPANPCHGIDCQNGGTCIEGKCTCATGFSGARCEVKSNCDPASCLNGGKCMNNVCVCSPGFSGPTCAVPDTNNRCAGVVCQNGGTCQPESGSCRCFGNFKGNRCEIVPPPGQECLNIECKNGNVCKNGFCQCLNGFKGLYCEIDPCAQVTCLNNGKCSAGKCQCANGFTGDKCERNPCKGIKCKHGGTCVAGSCKCTKEWEGARCEISMKTPAPFDVKPTMIPAWNQCACPNLPPVNCTVLVNNTCADNSTANVTHVNETISLANVSPFYPCHHVPCQNGGKCQEGKCKCRGNYGGLLCELDTCAKVSCQNGGICKKGACTCPMQFKGEFCEQNSCDGVTCMNGGVCKLGMCECLPDFEGSQCELKSELGTRRKSMLDRISKITARLEHLNATVPNIKNITNFGYVSENIANASHQMLAAETNRMQKMHDSLSNSFHKPPRQLKDREGKYRWHQETPPGVRAHRIKQVELPPADRNKLETKLRPLVKAEELNTNATQDHKDFPENMKKLESMALTETEGEAEFETEADMDSEAHLEGEAEGETEAYAEDFPSNHDVELLEIEAQIDAELDSEEPALDASFF